MNDVSVIHLPERLDDVTYGRSLNQRLRGRGHLLHWGAVRDVSDDALGALVDGLSLDDVVDRLGSDTMADTVAVRVLSAFDAVPESSTGGAAPAGLGDAALAWDPYEMPTVNGGPPSSIEGAAEPEADEDEPPPASVKRRSLRPFGSSAPPAAESTEPEEPEPHR